MGQVAVGAMVVGTSLLVVFALAMATLESQVEDSLTQIASASEPLPQFTIENANNVEGAVVSWTINSGGTGYSSGQVSVNGSAGTFLADLVISTGGVVTGLNVLNHGSSYLYSSTYYLEITGPNTGNGLNITANLGNLVYVNITNDGSEDISTDVSWLFTDGTNPRNLSDGYHGYSPDLIFSGETKEFYYYSGAQATVSRIAIGIDGINKASIVA
ncbi:MAG: hypothetical protein QGI21_06455 [Candidatus Poseidoniaceae archaeon]|jgi:hypothetical protein|nr:hypothetical protein [Candidatus Poseidoniaceae archaeon]